MLELEYKNTTDDELKKQYKKLAKKYHPDNSETGNNVKFKQLTEANKILKDTMVNGVLRLQRTSTSTSTSTTSNYSNLWGYMFEDTKNSIFDYNDCKPMTVTHFGIFDIQRK